MKGGGVEVLRKVLRILPLVQGNQGIRVSELARQSGIPEEEIMTDLPALVNLCGVPPYSPMDLVDLEIEGDRVKIRFADQFKRPVRLTLREAIALDMALAGWEERGEGPFGRAVSSLRKKVRDAVAPEVADEVSRAGARIGAPADVGQPGRIVSLMKEAVGRQVAVRMEYFSRNSGRLSEREVHPYGIYEQGGHWFLVGLEPVSGLVKTFRADRVRMATLTARDYEIPLDFDVGRYRREGPVEPEGEALEVKVRFDPESARFAREEFPASEWEEHPDGSVVATVKTNRTFWLVSELLPWGGHVSIRSPDSFRVELADQAGAALALYGDKGYQANSG